MQDESFNQFVRAIANEQKIEPNSSLWLSAGESAISGNTGAKSSYGWRHDHLLNQDFVKAAIANYGHRPSFYVDEDYRKGGYQNGGRPVNYVPQEINSDGTGDQMDGSYMYKTSKGKVDVSGPDATHFHLGTLAAVFDSGEQYTATVHGKEVAAIWAAKGLMQHLCSSMIGMQRKENGGWHDYGDRGQACCMKALVQAFPRECVLQKDLVQFVYWMQQKFFPKYLNAPGHGYNHQKKFGNPPKYIFQTYNGIYWLLPPIYDALNLAIDAETVPELVGPLQEITDRFSQWMLDILEAAGNFKVGHVEVNKQAIEANSKAPTNLAPYIIGLTDIKDWHEVWAYRACSIAGEILNSKKLRDECKKIRANNKGPDDKKWFVDFSGEYVD